MIYTRETAIAVVKSGALIYILTGGDTHISRDYVILLYMTHRKRTNLIKWDDHLGASCITPPLLSEKFS